MTMVERFFKKVKKTKRCWRWTGAKTLKGYGIFSQDPDQADKSVKRSAHRYSYELHKGQIPKGLEIDHLCRIRDCVNPDHLEAVTHAENVKRSLRKQCKAGHEFTEGSFYQTKSGRLCKECTSQKNKRRWIKFKAGRPDGRTIPKTHCRNGHEYNKTGFYMIRGARSCKVCNLANHRRWVQKNNHV